MLLSLTGNSKPIKKQVTINKMLKENSKDIAKIGDDILDRLYINKNNESKAKGSSNRRNAKTEDAK